MRTSTYNPKANGMVERMHRTLKVALRARQGNRLRELPVVLLGMRMRPDDNGHFVFSLVTGEKLLVPHILAGDFNTADLQCQLDKLHFKYNSRRTKEAKIHLPNELWTCKFP